MSTTNWAIVVFFVFEIGMMLVLGGIVIFAMPRDYNRRMARMMDDIAATKERLAKHKSAIAAKNAEKDPTP